MKLEPGYQLEIEFNNIEKNDVAPDFMDTTLLELVLDSKTSIRLRNCIIQSSKTKYIPLITISEYLSAKGNACKIMTNIQNLGRKSAHELDCLIHKYVEKNQALGNPLKYKKEIQSPPLPESNQNIFTWNGRNLDTQILEVRLLDIVNTKTASVRLRNIFFDNKKILKSLTLGDYLINGVSTLSLVKKLKNCGKTSTDELITLIEEYLDESNEVESTSYNQNAMQFSNLPQHPFDNTTELAILYGVNDDIFNKTIADIVLSKFTSVRLKNIFNDKTNRIVFNSLTIRDYLTDKQRIRKQILKCKNCGKGTIEEMFQVISDYIDGCQQIPENKIMTELSVSDVITKLCLVLDQREQLVLSHRYGTGNNAIYTLDELGGRLSVTRERVRQIEMKAIRKLSVPNHRELICAALIKNKNEICKIIFDDSDIVWFEHLPRIARDKINGELSLAIKIAYGSLTSWLNEFSQEIKGGWTQGKFSSDAIENCRKQIDNFIATVITPIPFALLAHKIPCETELLKLCIARDQRISIFDGIAFQGRIGRRKRRQARLFYLLCARLLPLAPLVSEYNKSYLAEKCSCRDAQIVMIDAPNLFIGLGDEGWTSISDESESDLTAPQYKFSEPIPNDADDTEETVEIEEVYNLVYVVRRLLEENGPMHFIELRDLFMKAHSDAYSSASLAPVLLTYDIFVRLAPGIYGLSSHLDETTMMSCKTKIIRESDCLLYIMARYAGEKIGSFPWWTPKMEHEWCKWAQRIKNESLFCSLMAIVEPTNWDVTDAELQYWIGVKRKKAHFSHRIDHKHNLSECTPTLREIYALAVVAKKHSSMNWIRVNRILGRRLNDHHAASYLAALVALGALKSAEHWQLQHFPGSNLNALITELSNQLSRNPYPKWDSDFGRVLSSTMMQYNSRSVPLGWVDGNSLAEFLNELGENITTGKFVGSANGTINPDCVLHDMLNEKVSDDNDDIFCDLIDDLIK